MSAKLRSLGFVIAALGCLTAAILHMIALFVGPRFMAFLGAPISADAPAIPLSLTLTTLIIAAILFLWLAYALSALGVMKRLPGTAPACGIIGGLLVVRGVFFVPQLVALSQDVSFFAGFHTVMSGLILLMGLGFLGYFLRPAAQSR